jgi:hypothetical protein
MSATATKPVRERLKEVEANLDGLRDKLKDAKTEKAAAQAAFAGAENMRPGTPEFEAANEATKAVQQIEQDIRDETASKVLILEMLGEEVEVPTGPNAGNDRYTRDVPAGWNSSSLFDSDMQAQLAQAAFSKQRFGGMELGQVADRETLAADIAPTANMRRGDYYGSVPQLLRPLRVLDLVPTGTMDGNLLPYTQEGGTFLGAAETTEGSTKPEANVTYTDASAVAQTIAAWMKIKKQALADVPALRSIIDGRLRYGVLRRLENQTLNGDGSDPNIRGILATSGIGAVTYNAAELAADQVLRGITTILLADALADAIVMHPTDWQNVMIAKAAGDGHYYGGGPFGTTQQTMWGVPLIASPAIPVGMALVGDFGMGATLFIREGVNVLFSDSDGDDFRQNRVTLLAEMRAALAVWRPAAFCSVDLAA